MPMPRGVIDSIIEDMMLQQQAGGRQPSPLDISKRQLGPVQKLWEGIGKKMYGDFDRAFANGVYRPPPPLTAEATPTMTATPQNVRGSMPLAPDTRERQADNNAANWRVLVENAMREQMLKQMQAGGQPTPEWTPPEPAAYDEPQ